MSVDIGVTSYNCGLSPTTTREYLKQLDTETRWCIKHKALKSNKKNKELSDMVKSIHKQRARNIIKAAAKRLLEKQEEEQLDKERKAKSNFWESLKEIK